MSESRWCPACRTVQPVQAGPSQDHASLRCATCATPLDEAGAAAPRPTVLCIDDDPLVLQFYREFLDRRGYRTLLVTDGLAGIAMAERERPEIILLDVMLRGLSGFDICRKLRAEPTLCEIPIILLTAWDHPSLATTGRAAGANVTLRKPEDAETLITALEQVLAETPGPPRR